MKEYAEIVCKVGAGDEDATFDDSIDIYEDAINLLESTEPPSDVAEWHHATIAAWKGVLDLLTGSGISEEDSLAAFEALYPLTQAVLQAEASMSPESLRELEQAGCR